MWILCRSKLFSFAQHLLSPKVQLLAYSGLGELEEVDGFVI